MVKLNNIVRALATAPALTIALSANANVESKVQSRSMQCFAIYQLMIDEEQQNQFQNKLLQDQSVFMAMINIAHGQNKNPAYNEDEFNRIWDFVSKAHIRMGQADPDLFADRLIQCEGWREDLVRYYASEAGKPDEEVIEAEVLLGVPEPLDNYPLTGASRDQVVSAVKSALSNKQ